MSKDYKTTNDQESQQETSTTSSAATVDTSSNQNEVQEAGIDGGGVEPGEMGLTGSFAEMVLDCLPMVAAVPLALKYGSNPAVRAWCQRQTLADIASALGGAANVLLKDLWPVGIGFQGEGALGGRLGFGGSGVAGYEAIRTGVNDLSMRVESSVSCGLGGGAVGATVGDAFGETAAEAIAKAKLNAGADYEAKTVTDFDLVSLLSSGVGFGSMTLDTALFSPFQLIANPEWLGDYIERDAPRRGEWGFSHEIWIQGKAKAGAHPVSEEMSESLGFQLAADQGVVEMIQHLVPVMEVAASGRLGIVSAGDGQVVLNGELSCSGIIQVINEMPILKSVLSPSVDALLRKGVEAGTNASMTLSFDSQGDLKLPLVANLEASFITLTGTTDVDGMTVQDELRFGLGEDVSVGDGGEEECSSNEWIADATRTVSIDLDAARMDEACPEHIRQILGVTDTFMQSQASLQLVGSATLSKDAISAALGELGFGDLDVARLAIATSIDIAAGQSVEVPDVLSGYRTALNTLAQSVTFSEARLKGSIMQGQGGSMEVVVGGSTSATARAAGGVVIDQVVSEEDARMLRNKIVGGRSAA